MKQLFPGTAHPFPVQSLADLGHTFGLRPAQLQAFLDAGMPGSPQACEPFACYTWICWHRLPEAPLLARRWRHWQHFYAPALSRQPESRSLRWQRQHRLFLPQGWRLDECRVPVVPDRPEQALLTSTPPALWRQEAGWWQATGDIRRFAQQLHLRRSSFSVGSAAAQTALARALEDLIGAFRYGYRQHALADDLPGAQARGCWGSCLDCALLAAEALAPLGPSRLVVGIWGHSHLANPHYWLEVCIDDRWLPVDPSMGAIARMLGLNWRQWLRTWCGFEDARRLRLHTVGEPGLFVGGHPGSVLARDADGTLAQAWACWDWVCGLCSDSFAHDSSCDAGECF